MAALSNSLPKELLVADGASEEKSAKVSIDPLVVGAIVIAVLIAVYFWMSRNKTAPAAAIPAGRKPTLPPNQLPKPPAELTQKLRRGNITLFGSMSCPHTVRQLEVIGGKNSVNYVECTASSDDRCKKIRAFPTWSINGNLYPGFRNPDQLLKLINSAPSEPPQNKPQVKEVAAPVEFQPMGPI